MDIRCYSPAWARDIADLYYQSVHAIDSAVYTPEQKQAWAPAPIDYQVGRALGAKTAFCGHHR